MTTEVKITNAEGEHGEGGPDIVLRQLYHPSRCLDEIVTLKPGESCTRYLHATSMLEVVEVTPVDQWKPPGFDFGEAIRALKSGERVARRGWNGKGMWLALAVSGTYSALSELFRNCPAASQYAAAREDRHAVVAGSIVMRAADGSLVFGWLASQTDMLAEDWVLVTE